MSDEDDEDSKLSTDDVTPTSNEHLTDHERLLLLEKDIRATRRVVGAIREDIRWAIKKVLGFVIVALLGGLAIKFVPSADIHGTPTRASAPATASPSTSSDR